MATHPTKKVPGGRKPGRPKTEIEKLKAALPEDWKAQLLAMGDKGKGVVQMQAELLVFSYEWYRLMKEDKEFSNTVKKALLLSEAWWLNKGQDNLIEQYRGSKLNYVGWYMNMKNRFKWSDKVETKNVDEDGNVIKPEIKVEIVNYGTGKPKPAKPKDRPTV